MRRSPKMSSDHGLLVPKAFYLFYFAAMACLFPYIALYYEQIGLSGRQIGALRGISPLVSLFSAPLWGWVADATRQHKRLLVMAIGSAWLAVLALSFTTTYFWLILIVSAYAFLGTPIAPLVDSAVVELLGERRDEYGQQRLWGAVGWGVAAPIAGLVIERSGLQWAFYGYLLLMFGVLTASLCLSIDRSSIGRRSGKGLRALLTNWQWILFLLTVFVGGISQSFVVSFLFLHMNDLGASKSLMGFSLTIATLSELPIWFLSDRLLKRWGSRGLLAASLLACLLQSVGYSLVRNPWLMLPIQLLQGPAFSAMWAAGVSYTAEITPEGTRAAAQGLFSGVAGLRASIGAFIGGALYDTLGAVSMFQLGGVGALLGLALFVLAGRGTLRPKPTSS